MLLLDTSAWIEFFIKSEKGKIVKSYLKDYKCFTSIASISEISNWSKREGLDNNELIKYIIDLGVILNLNLEIANLAGILNLERKKVVKNWGMIDSLILATSQFYDIKVLTKDKHFENISNVLLL